MKFFFHDLGLCFGGTVITSTTETVSSDDVSTTRRRVTRGHSAKHWKPELSAISEDGGVSRHGHESVRVVGSDKKPLSKSRSAGKTRSHSYRGDYRKFSHTMAIPAFSPTPFVF